jgi:hypothetical protein
VRFLCAEVRTRKREKMKKNLKLAKILLAKYIQAK